MPSAWDNYLWKVSEERPQPEPQVLGECPHCGETVDTSTDDIYETVAGYCHGECLDDFLRDFACVSRYKG